MGYWSHYDHRVGRSSWPLPATASCWELGEFARVHKVLHDTPMEGDVFLPYSPALRRFAHTGVVVSVDQRIETEADRRFVCTTVEGNTNADGSRDGRMTLRKVRSFSVKNGDRFIHRPELHSRQQAA